MGMHSVGRLISIVEDDPLVREGLISLLRSAGFAIQALPQPRNSYRSLIATT